MKTMISTLLRRYRILPGDKCRSMGDIRFEFGMTIRPLPGNDIRLERRDLWGVYKRKLWVPLAPSKIHNALNTFYWNWILVLQCETLLRCISCFRCGIGSWRGVGCSRFAMDKAILNTPQRWIKRNEICSKMFINSIYFQTIIVI